MADCLTSTGPSSSFLSHFARSVFLWFIDLAKVFLVEKRACCVAVFRIHCPPSLTNRLPRCCLRLTRHSTRRESPSQQLCWFTNQIRVQPQSAPGSAMAAASQVAQLPRRIIKVGRQPDRSSAAATADLRTPRCPKRSHHHTNCCLPLAHCPCWAPQETQRLLTEPGESGCWHAVCMQMMRLAVAVRVRPRFTVLLLC